MHLQKVRAEVLYDRFIVIRSLPERCDAVFNQLTVDYSKAVTDYFRTFNPLSNFVFNRSVLSARNKSKLSNRRGHEPTQEKHQMHTFKQAIGTNLREQLQRIVDPVRSGILFEVLVTMYKQWRQFIPLKLT